MNTIVTLLQKHPQISDYKINICNKESFELFFVKGKLETTRCTDTCDKQVTLYVDHDGYRGNAAFFVYPSDTEDSMEEKIASTIQNAQIINNKPYTLPGGETGEYTIESNLQEKSISELAFEVADTVFAANTLPNAALNSVEIFLNKYTDTVANSQGLHKTQHRYTAMVEAIPTYNGDQQSVELYEQYHFSSLDPETLREEIAGKLQEVKARYEATKPELPMDCKVVLNKLELSELLFSIADDLNYSTVYGHSNLYSKGDLIQKHLTGDPISIRMAGSVPGNINSACFDSDGMSLKDIQLVEDGKVINYYGSSRFGQYLNETPTGNLRCLSAKAGSADLKELKTEPHLEVISMSGLQVDFFNDYIGGEIRLAYYHDGDTLTPVTGISISGKLQDVLSSIRLSTETATHNGYTGPAKAVLSGMKIF